MNGLSIPYFNIEQWSNSPGALRLGSALLHFVWQGAALGLFAFVVLALLHRARPQARYAMLLAILAAMVACPIVTFLIADTQHETAALARQPEVALIDRAMNSGTNEPAPAFPLVPHAPSANGSVPLTESPELRQNPPAAAQAAASPAGLTLTWNDRWAAAADWLHHRRHQIVAAWLFGVCVLSLRLTIGLFGAERARRRGITPVPVSVEQTAHQLAERLGIRRPVRVVVAALAEVPALVGWLRPAILLPFSTLNGLTPDQLEAILAHELAHVRRHDYLVNLLQTVVETILFYHPAVWWISRRIRQEREHCCDDDAVSICGDRVAYARTLATLENLRTSMPRNLVAAAGGSLTTRIRRLLGEPAPAIDARPALAFVGAAVLAAVALTSDSRPATSAEELPTIQKQSPTVFVEKLPAGQNQLPTADSKRNEKKTEVTPIAELLEMHFRMQILADKIEFVETEPRNPAQPMQIRFTGNVKIQIFSRGEIPFDPGENLSATADSVVVRSPAMKLHQLAPNELRMADDAIQVSMNGNVRLRHGSGRTELSATSVELNLSKPLPPVTKVSGASVDPNAFATNVDGNKPSDPAEKKTATDPRMPWSVRGRVTDGDGKPMQGVTVHASTGIGSLHTTGKADTDADGKYEFAFGPGIAFANNDVQLQAATISAHKAGFFEKNLSRQGDLVAALKLPEGEIGWGKKTKDDVILPGKPRELNYVMLPAAKVAGTLIDKDQKPLVGYSVSITGPELPPSSGVVEQTKTDEKGRFVLDDLPTGFAFQFLVEPAKHEPPWNAWASGLYRFKSGGNDELFIQQEDKELAAQRFEIQVIGAGTNWKKSLLIGADHQKLTLVGDSLESKSRVHAATARLVLDPPGSAESPESLRISTAPSATAGDRSKTNLKRTKPDADGKFTLTFENPVPRRGNTRMELDPEKHQVIFQVFVRNAEGKLQEKIFKQLPARKTGGYQADMQVKPDLIEHSSVSLTFVTIQPEHDKWVKTFFHEGKGTKYSGIWSSDGGKLPTVAMDDKVTGWIMEPERAKAGDKKDQAQTTGAESTITISGRVTDNAGRGLSDALVSLPFSDPAQRPIPRRTHVVRTDAQGHFRAELPANWMDDGLASRLDLWCWSKGRELGRLPLDLRKSTDLVLKLEPESPVSFSVRDHEGKAVAGALMEPLAYAVPAPQPMPGSGGRSAIHSIPVEFLPNLQAFTDSEGNGRFASLSWRHLSIVRCQSTTFGAQDTFITLKAPDDVVQMKLKQPVRIEGQVKCDSPDAVKDFRFWVSTTNLVNNPQIVSTSEDGTFGIPAMPPGRIWIDATAHLGLNAAWWARHQSEYNLKSGESAKVDVQLEKPVLIRGRILEKDTNKPVPNVDLYVRTLEGSGHDEVRTDADGRFTARALAGKFRVNFESGDWAAVDPTTQFAVANAGDKATEMPPIFVEPMARINGKLVDAEGRPIPGASVYPLSPAGKVSIRATTNLRGEFVLRARKSQQSSQYEVEDATGAKTRSIEIAQLEPLVLRLKEPIK